MTSNSQAEQKAIAAASALLAKQGRMGAQEFVGQLLTVWKQAPFSNDLFAVVAGSFAQMGLFEQTLMVIGEATAAQGETALICKVLGKIALKMNKLDLALKSFIKAMQLDPEDADTLADCSKILIETNRFKDALAVIDQGLQRLPHDASLYDIKGQAIMAHTGNRFEAMENYQKAVDLDPQNASYIHNLALSHLFEEEADGLYRSALQIAPDNPQINLSYAIYLFRTGHIDRAWGHYSHRLNTDLGPKKAADYDHGLPPLMDDEIKGKTVFLCSEQGIGDEIFFTSAVPAALAEGAQVILGCDPRLVSLYERSFPGVRAFGHQDAHDFQVRRRCYPGLGDFLRDQNIQNAKAIAAGSLMARFAGSVDAFRCLRGGFLKPRPEDVDHYGGLIQKTPNRRKIGIFWRSGNLQGDRNNFYETAQLFYDLATSVDADFFVLQYDVKGDEQELLRGLDNVHFFEGVDLKQDIEANIAIMANLDFVIGPPTATQMFAMAVGCPVWLISAGLPWTFLGERVMEPLYAPGSSLFLAYDLRFEKKSYLDALLEAFQALERGSTPEIASL